MTNSWALAYFNPRPHTGATAVLPLTHENTLYFNPRPHTGATCRSCTLCVPEAIFQSTPPYGGDAADNTHTDTTPNFNPRPHTGATRDRQGLDGGRKISIHAPIRGRPATSAASALAHLISIHAPIRGRRASTATAMRPLRFQSTPPYGGDNSSCICPGISAYFNPRPHTGATFIILTGSKTFLFQSTPPYGGDGGDTGYHARWHYFNPRPHTGATHTLRPPFCRDQISIHAPIRGRRQMSVRVSRDAGFQSTPPYGGDATAAAARPCSADFNPRPHTGATWGEISQMVLYGISIHAPIRGRRLRAKTNKARAPFQSTPPYGGDGK